MSYWSQETEPGKGSIQQFPCSASPTPGVSALRPWMLLLLLLAKENDNRSDPYFPDRPGSSANRLEGIALAQALWQQKGASMASLENSGTTLVQEEVHTCHAFDWWPEEATSNKLARVPQTGQRFFYKEESRDNRWNIFLQIAELSIWGLCWMPIGGPVCSYP